MSSGSMYQSVWLLIYCKSWELFIANLGNLISFFVTLHPKYNKFTLVDAQPLGAWASRPRLMRSHCFDCLLICIINAHFLIKCLDISHESRIFTLDITRKFKNSIFMEPNVGDIMKVSPDLTGLDGWVQGEIIDVEHNPFTGLVLSIKDNLGRIFFGQSKYFSFT